MPPPAEIVPWTVALVDDHTPVRIGFETMLHRHGEFRVVLSAGNGEAFIAGLAGLPQVDLAIVDLRMPGMDGFAVLQWLRNERSDIRSVALSFSREAHSVRRAIEAGACGYLEKTMQERDVRTTLMQVMRKGRHHSDLIVDSLLSPTAVAEVPRTAEVFTTLPERAREFLRHLLDPMDPTYAQIAARMGVTEFTVHSYFRYFRRHFDLHSRAALVRWALEQGWGRSEVA